MNETSYVSAQDFYDDTITLVIYSLIYWWKNCLILPILTNYFWLLSSKINISSHTSAVCAHLRKGLPTKLKIKMIPWVWSIKSTTNSIYALHN